MSIFNLVPFIIIAISAPVLAVGNPGYYYYPSYYPPHHSPRHDSPPDGNDHSGGAGVDVLELYRPTGIIPTEARPPYASPAYGPPTAYTSPAYNPPAVPIISPHPVKPGQAYDFVPKPPTHKAPADAPAYHPPAENGPSAQNQADKSPSEAPAYKPPAETTVYNSTRTTTAPTQRHPSTLRPKKPPQSPLIKVPHMRSQPSKAGRRTSRALHNVRDG